MKSILIAGALAGLVSAAAAQAPAADATAAPAATPSKPALTKADRKKLKADRQQLKHDHDTGRTASRATDKQAVAGDRAQLSSDAGHVVGRKHGGARKGSQQ